MNKPKSLENCFIRYDITSHEVAPVGGTHQLMEHIKRYGSVVVRDLMTNTPVEVYEVRDRLLGRPIGKVGICVREVVHH